MVLVEYNGTGTFIVNGYYENLSRIILADCLDIDDSGRLLLGGWSKRSELDDFTNVVVTLDPSGELLTARHFAHGGVEGVFHDCEWIADVGALVTGYCPSSDAAELQVPSLTARKLGGSWGIGSDSNLCVNPPEELRLLEFGQRLRDQQRNLMADPGSIVGADLYKNALRGGLQALAKPPAKGFAVGQRADFLVFDQQHPMLLGKQGDHLLDAWVFGGCSEMLSQVWVAGQCQIENGQHKDFRFFR